MSAIASRNQPVVLPQRTLLRHVTWSLPSGQAVAKAMRVPPLGVGDLAEVLLGLLQLDPGSYFNVRPRWGPTLPDRTGTVTGGFRMVDFLTFAGVDPTRRGQ